MPKDPYQYFRPEARDLLERLGRGVLELEKQGGAEPVARLLRLAHTLKGAAGVVKQRDVADRAHSVEDALTPYRDSATSLPPAASNLILRLIDEMHGLVTALGAPATPAPARADSFRDSRVGVVETDAVLNGVTESFAQLNAVRAVVKSIDRTRDLAEVLVKQLAVRSVRDGAAPAGTFSRDAYSTAEALRHVVGGLERHFTSSLDDLERELRLARQAAEQLRLAPAGMMFAALERTARDAAHALGKRVNLEATGGNVRVEAQVLAAVQDALVQATRNAVAHGIEPEELRKAAGKGVAGRVRIVVTPRGRQVIFRCQDDGRGVDLEAVRRVAVQRGLPPSQASQLDSEGLMRLLLQGGISTSAVVTEVSGRGIGLDVVREVAEQLRGQTTLQTEAGQGTTVELIVPVALASVEALVVDTGGLLAAIPLHSVRQTLRITADGISRTARGEAVVHNGRMIPFATLSRLLTVRSAQPRASRIWSAVIVEGAGGVAAIGVDRLLGTARVVLRPLPAHTPADAMVAGASLDAAGNPQLVLDADGLVTEALREEPSVPRTEPVSRPVLVIDDSLTTRMLEQSILESAGYEVETAVSGEQALERARHKPFALFLVDVEMSGMDGFTFVERARSESTLRNVPAILVTSRSSPEDRQRGLQVGAQDYIVKSEFNQAALLARIKQLLA